MMNRMKSLTIIGLSLFWLAGNAQAQSVHTPESFTTTVAVQTGPMQPGYYRTYHEVLTNAPGIPWDTPALTPKKSRVVIGKHFPSVKLDLTRDQGRALGDFVGFSDGQHLYLRVSNEGKAWRDHFSQVQVAGPYLVHSAVLITYTASGNGTFTRWTSHITKALNLGDGRYTTVGKKELRALLADEPQLLAEFEAERRKGRKISEYLIRYGLDLES
ncbi:MAG TPA: hypothetical protein DCR93_32665 [Cytophagales bacterium]|nr:hypothetical protein [Cytophagales bacterium]HAP64041.1 hypothetical protein [Cytophagales bacterium]